MATDAQLKNVVGERTFTLSERISIWFISTLATLAIFLIGITIRWKVETETGAPVVLDGPAIFCFWHQCIFALAWPYRNRGMAVMTSRSLDGEFIAHTIENLGYQAVRGSSSRGGVGALLNMHKMLKDGFAAVFTIDGPRGPRHIAKPGAVLLAKNSHVPLTCVHVALRHKWTINSWDAMMVPVPFTRGYVRVARPISVPADATDLQMEQFQNELQSGLERVMHYAEDYFLKKHPSTPDH